MHSEDSSLNCSICHEQYDEPTILPCCQTICKKCIPKILIKIKKPINTTQFKCSLCNGIHELPKSGFPINKLATSLIKDKPKFTLFKQDNKSDLLRKSLQIIKIDNEKLRQSVFNPTETIDLYCAQLEQQIQTATNKKIEQINDLNQKLLNEINLFKKQCLKTFDKETRDIYQDTNLNIDKFYEKWTTYLLSPDKDQDELTEAVLKSKKLQFSLKKSRFDTENLIFNSKLLDFDENSRPIQLGTLGVLVYKNKTISLFKDLQTIDLKKNFKDQHSVCKYIKLTSLENGNYIAAYFSANDSIRLVLIDRNFTSIKEKNETAHSAGFFINYFKLYSHRNNLVLYSWNSKSYMKIFDENLIPKAFFPNFEGYFTALTFDDSNIICLDALKSMLYIYDWNIKLQLTLRTNNVDLNYYLPNNTTQIESFESKIFLKHKNYISVINQSDGKFIKSFNGITAAKFLIDKKERYLITISDDMKRIVYYTFDGEIIYENEMINFPENLKYFIDYNGRIIFFDDLKAIMFK